MSVSTKYHQRYANEEIVSQKLKERQEIVSYSTNFQIVSCNMQVTGAVALC